MGICYTNDRPAPPAEGELREYEEEKFASGHRVYRLPLGGGIYLEVKASVVGCYDGFRSRPAAAHLHALRHALEDYLPENLRTPLDPGEDIPATADVAGALDALGKTYRPKPPRPSLSAWSPDPAGLPASVDAFELPDLFATLALKTGARAHVHVSPSP